MNQFLSLLETTLIIAVTSQTISYLGQTLYFPLSLLGVGGGESVGNNIPHHRYQKTFSGYCHDPSGPLLHYGFPLGTNHVLQDILFQRRADLVI